MSKSRRTEVTLDELFSYCSVTETGCIEWQRNRDKDGYGRFRLNGDKRRVNRIVCFLTYGQPPANAVAMHTCDNPPCINPDHLRWGSHKDNWHDMVAKGRKAPHHGVLTGSAKLTDEIVLEIRASRLELGQYAMAGRKYGVTPGVIGNILKGKTWKHLLSDE